MKGAARTLGIWLLLWSALNQAEPLLAVAPNVERQQRAIFEASYSALHHLIAGQAGLDTRLKFLPIAEVRAMLARREAQVQLGGICGVKRNVPVLYTLPYARFERHLVTAGDTPAITSLSDPRVLRLGLVEGYFYQLPNAEELEKLGVETYYSKDLKGSVQVLLAGRVDAILANAYVVNNIAKSLSQTGQLNYTMDAPFSERNACYVLPKTPASEALVEQINHAIIDLFHNGTLQRYIIPPYQPPKSKSLMLKAKAQ